ncbi:MAG TPA: hypothetical protein VGA52_13270 [Anaerolineales bacterium]|jgi:hypothetical protein
MASKTRVPTTDEALEYAVRSIRRADIKTGQAALRWVLRREPENISAWLWLKKCVESNTALDNEVLTRVSALNPMLSSN